jgi:hypothetical protein
MKDQAMSEPISGTAAGVFGFKALGGLAGIGAGLSALVVMCMLTPRSPREWAVGLISTVIASVCGGSFIIEHYQLQSMMGTATGNMTVIGIIFAAGLPGWALVRWVFNYIQKNQNKDISEIAKDIKEAM